MIGKCQYHRQYWDKTFLPWTHKLVNEWVNQSTFVGICMNNLYDRFIRATKTKICEENKEVSTDFKDHRRHNRLSIMTLGNSNSIGFANTCHVDKNDCFLPSFQKFGPIILNDIKSEAKVEESKEEGMRYVSQAMDYLSKLHSVGKFGVMTVCGYKKLVWNDMVTEDEVVGYFLNIGLGTCYPIESNMFHGFFGHLFAHQTCVPLIVQDGHVLYTHTSAKIFACGGGRAS